MKLYTEEQVKILLNALIDIKNWNEELEDEWEDCGYRAIEAINEFADKEEIELPSDEEIENIMISKYPYSVGVGVNHFIKTDERIGFEEGAKWMKKQILNQNNNL